MLLNILLIYSLLKIIGSPVFAIQEYIAGLGSLGSHLPAQSKRLEKDIPHLFDRFFKADEAHTGDGTGLGLAITEEVLRLMGESITVKYEKALIRFTFTVSKKEAE